MLNQLSYIAQDHRQGGWYLLQQLTVKTNYHNHHMCLQAHLIRAVRR